jgi:hypothetical protein
VNLRCLLDHVNCLCNDDSLSQLDCLTVVRSAKASDMSVAGVWTAPWFFDHHCLGCTVVRGVAVSHYDDQDHLFSCLWVHTNVITSRMDRWLCPIECMLPEKTMRNITQRRRP